MDHVDQLRAVLGERLPLGFGVSGALGTRLFTYGDVAQLMAAARDAGISIFDTSPSYGAGLAEQRLGRAIGNDPSAFVMTKAGLVASGLLKRAGNFAPGAISESIDQSLNRLQRERIDLLWLHGPGRGQLTDELFGALEAALNAGKVAAFGVASRDHGIRKHLATGPFAAFMGPANHTVELPKLEGAQPLFFGIETLKGVRADSGPALRRSVLWKTAKSVVRGNASDDRAVSLEDAFEFAFKAAKCDLVVSTSTKPARLEENAEICRRYGGLAQNQREHPAALNPGPQS